MSDTGYEHSTNEKYNFYHNQDGLNIFDQYFGPATEHGKR